MSVAQIGLNSSYVGSRSDILHLVPNNARKVLDIGCSIGALGKSIKETKGAEVIGIEIDEIMAEVAKKDLDRVITGDIEEIDFKALFELIDFDCIIFADVLEHLKDPWHILRTITAFLACGGVVIASIPNVRHYTTISSLAVKGYWPYRDRGIHDKSHLRFFTFQNIQELFQESGLEIIEVKRHYRIIESPNKLNKFSQYFALPLLKEFLTFQYLVVARKVATD
jgi:methionine biosynthesis protein MetW